MQKKIELILLIIFMIALSFFRESFFKSVNVVINFPDWDEALNDSIFSFLKNFGTAALVKIKWMATFGFIFLFYLLTLIISKKMFPEFSGFILITLSFGGIILIAGFGMLLGWLIPSINQMGYYFARWITGSAQSPLLPSILCLIIYYHNKAAKKL